MEEKDHFITFLIKAGITFDAIEYDQISAGGNNRAFLVKIDKKNYIIKQYFRHINDSRDRLSSEYSFLSYAQKAAPGWTPKPIFKDNINGLALYEFIKGRRYTINDLDIAQVLSAAKFFAELNTLDSRQTAVALPLASEACFSINAHAELIRGRIENLCRIEPLAVEDREAVSISQELKKSLNKFTDVMSIRSKKFKISMNDELSQAERCVSPSDFGFHNALMTAECKPQFLDFEYAGWDDPAKMTCDFFSQLSLPIPDKYFLDFCNICFSSFPEPDKIINRALLLKPLYKIKWCCIALNVFLAENLSRRKFANGSINEQELKYNQIVKSRALLKTVGEF